MFKMWKNHAVRTLLSAVAFLALKVTAERHRWRRRPSERTVAIRLQSILGEMLSSTKSRLKYREPNFVSRNFESRKIWHSKHFANYLLPCFRHSSK